MKSNRTSLISLRRASRLFVLTSLAGSLSACYVVPIDHPVVRPQSSLPVAAQYQPVSLSARLYPDNDVAQVYGVITATISNELNGRGQFAVNIAGENFTGEATRSGRQLEGIANGAGNRGSFLRCQYKMNSSTQGTGRCLLSNGASFAMHIGT
jgi:hypothetical protein